LIECLEFWSFVAGVGVDYKGGVVGFKLHRGGDVTPLCTYEDKKNEANIER
jgi:hypothetical protein